MKKLLATLWASIAILAIVTGCSTVSPANIKDAQARPDSSTPSQYQEFNNGFIGYRTIDGRRQGVITPAKRHEYNQLISVYKAQFLMVYAVKLEPDAGVAPWTDEFGNKLYSIDKQHLVYFGYLKTWQRDRRTPDSIFQKIGL